MLTKYDTEKLERAMYDFNRATGVSITLFDLDKNPVTFGGVGSCQYCASISGLKEHKQFCAKSNSELLDKCRKSRQLTKHICRAGLLDIAIPLIHAGEVVGYLMIGQIKQSPSFPEKLFEGGGEVYDLLRQQYELLPLFDEEKIDSIINIGTMLTKYIMLENMVHHQPSRISSVIESYVDEHLGEHISIDSLARKTHTSVSGIYKAIRQSFECTPGEFVCKRRIKKACALLADSELSISEISYAVGFTDAAHFSKKFKAVCGVSPLKYRKSADN